MSDKPMLAYHVKTDGLDTFYLVSLDPKFPIFKGLYDPTKKRLVLFDKKKYKTKVLMYDTIPNYSTTSPSYTYNTSTREEMVSCFVEHIMENGKDIRDFINKHVSNIESSCLEVLNTL